MPWTWVGELNRRAASAGGCVLSLLVAAALVTACSSKERRCAEDADCSDGLFCNGVEVCGANGVCAPGEPPALDDGVACTIDSCDEDADMVLHAVDDAQCSDGLFCNGQEICHAERGCQAGTPPVIDDQVACTDDTCDEATDTVVHVPNHAACTDTDACTNDVCSPGVGCTHMVVCTCSGPQDCDDQNPCTDDTCPAGDCVYINNTASCNDGLYCNGADTCSAGTCGVHGGDPCTGGPECANACNEAMDTCNRPAGSLCGSDGNACTNDVCDGGGACTHPNNSAPCNDGLFCNGADQCDAGACSLHAGDPCLACAGTCLEDADTCQYPQAAAPTISPPEGVYTQAQVISMSTTSPVTDIYFTKNGTTPSMVNGTRYTAPFLALIPETIRAITVGACFSPSDVTTSLIDVQDDALLEEACPITPAVAWSGTRWGVAWVAPAICGSTLSDWAILKFAVLDENGAPIAPPLSVTTVPSESRARLPAVTWNGTSFSLVWQDARTLGTRTKIYFAKIALDGALVDLPPGEADGVDDDQAAISTQTRNEQQPAILWDGTRHVVSWVDNRATYTDVYLAFLDADGRKLDLPAGEADGTDDDETRVSSQRFWISSGPTLTWTGNQIGVAWGELAPSQPARVYFGRVSATGAKLGNEVLLSPITSQGSSPSVAWNGTRYGVLWELAGTALRASFVDAAGVVQGTALDLGMGTQPAWTYRASASELEATWGQGGDVYIAAISAAGAVLVRNVLSNSGGTASRPQLASGPVNRCGIVWEDARTGVPGVRFSAVPKRP